MPSKFMPSDASPLPLLCREPSRTTPFMARASSPTQRASDGQATSSMEMDLGWLTCCNALYGYSIHGGL